MDCLSLFTAKYWPGVRGMRVFETRQQHRLALIIFYGSAALLAPWIVVLLLEQPGRVLGFHNVLLRSGTWAIFLSGLLVTGILSRHRKFSSLIFAVGTAVFCFVTAWFRVIGSERSALGVSLFFSVLVFLPFGVYSAWLARRVFESRFQQWRVPKWAEMLCYLGVVIALPFLLLSLRYTVEIVALHRMRLAWGGFDLFEFVALIATGNAIRNESPRTAIAAGVAGALLLCDAWFNIVSADGISLAAAIAMAVIEIPLACYALTIAFRVVGSWRALEQATPVSRDPVTE